jgi:hypothetical protein
MSAKKKGRKFRQMLKRVEEHKKGLNAVLNAMVIQGTAIQQHLAILQENKCGICIHSFKKKEYESGGVVGEQFSTNALAIPGGKTPVDITPRGDGKSIKNIVVGKMSMKKCAEELIHQAVQDGLGNGTIEIIGVGDDNFLK